MFPQFAVGRMAAPRKNTMKPRLGVPVSLTRGFVRGRPGQRCQPTHELHWTKYYMTRNGRLAGFNSAGGHGRDWDHGSWDVLF